MGRSDHLPALDGIRGLAALLVVLAHLPKIGLASAPAPLSGPLGVMLFFILSGFLMGHLYLAKPFDKASCSHYLAARAARVLPLYYLVVVGCFILSHLIGEDFAFYISDKRILYLMLLSGHDYVFWSIPPEVQFYFVFLLLWGLGQRGRLVAWLPVAAFLVSVLFVLRPVFPGISALGQLQIFLTGVAFAALRRVVVTRISPSAALVVQIGGLIACLLIIGGILPIHSLLKGVGRSKDDVAYASLPLALAVGSVLLAYTVDTRFARALFANRVAQQLGAWSFGIYLLHWPIMYAVHQMLAGFLIPQIAVGMLGLTVTIGAAATAYYLYEMPMQKVLRPRLARLLDRSFAIGNGPVGSTSTL
ncbi:acyltransferase [Novosphingobium sp. 9U]|uniref:acyltransferase family protein n=1 Tax=Novosphingobium sp. 9U TaxID=2653158 RepID=UPI001F157BB4|nr:acyltransferase [Novosphingobium sp. 9U]